MTPNTTLPTISLDSHGGWELILPAAVLPRNVANITITDDGIYLEMETGAYDLLTFDDLLDIAVPGRLVPVSHNGNGHWPGPTIYYVNDSPGAIPMH